jgi:hypothetical protein
VERRYRDKDGSWKSFGSFSRNEIPLVIFCLTKASRPWSERKVSQRKSEAICGSRFSESRLALSR